MLINGEFVPRASDGSHFASVSPANGRVIVGAEQLPQASAQDVDAAVQAAHRAFHARGPGSWSSLAPRARGALLFRLSELITQHQEELAVLEALDNGKTLAQARVVDTPASASMFKYWAGSGSHAQRTHHLPITLWRSGLSRNHLKADNHYSPPLCAPAV